MQAKKDTVDHSEIAHFAKDSAHWWDEDGPFKPLHRLNPVRMRYIRDQLCVHFGKDADTLQSLKGLSVLDAGCGGGLVCESLARMGANVTGIDADTQAIEVAKNHAAQSGLDITYESITTTVPTSRKKKYDAVLALEIIEHVSDVDLFVQDCAALCKPGGLVIFSTLNRTAKSFALGIVAAEYILGWVPRGTHQWKKFVRPAELAHALRDAVLNPVHQNGLIFNPVQNEFSLSDSDIDVNYLMTAEKTKS